MDMSSSVRFVPNCGEDGFLSYNYLFRRLGSPGWLLSAMAMV